MTGVDTDDYRKELQKADEGARAPHAMAIGLLLVGSGVAFAAAWWTAASSRGRAGIVALVVLSIGVAVYLLAR